MKKINLDQLANIARNIGRAKFTITFVKKDGTVRVMDCIKKFNDKGNLRYDPIEKGLLPVLDLHLQAPRMVNLKTIQQLEYLNKTFVLS